MPIRLNLLAEAQAAEELRRKDPVKRAILFGGACGALMVAASIVMQFRIIAIDHSVADYSGRIQAITNEFAGVIKDEERLRQATLRIRGLDILASERFLNGTLLDAMKKVHADDVQLIHLRTQHEYELTEETRAKTNATKVLKPAMAAETIHIVIEAMDVSANPGDQVNKFKEAITRNDHFQKLLGSNNEMRLVNLSPPQKRSDAAQPVVQFTLESILPEKVRLDIASANRYATPQAFKVATTAKPASQEPKL